MRLKSQKLNKGFTLLELLIVISIMGLLAGMIMVSFPGVQKRARLAQALQFSDSLRGSLQMDMIGWWPLDETSGTVAKDSWFDQNHGTLNGNPQWTEGVVNGALSFDGNGDYIAIPDSPLFNIQRLTIAAWVNFADNSSSFIFEKGNVNTQYSLFSHGTDIVFRTVPTSGGYDTLSTSKTLAGINNDQWHFIVGIYDGVIKRLYVDGKLILSRVWEYTININPNGSSIGRFGGTSAGYYFTGLIDNVQIYSIALPSATIQQHYAEGLKTHPHLVIKY